MGFFHCLVIGEKQGGGLQSLDVTFDEAYQRLETLPRMFLEPDGSFVWVSPHRNAARWQIDGNIQDAGPRLHSVILSGQCDLDSFRQLLSCFRRADERLAFELLQTGEYLAEFEFLSRFFTDDVDSA
jgi:hypothetical protein